MIRCARASTRGTVRRASRLGATVSSVATVALGSTLAMAGCKTPGQQGRDEQSAIVLPTGRVIHPTGRVVDVGNMPPSIAVARAGHYAALLLSGWRERGAHVAWYRRCRRQHRAERTTGTPRRRPSGRGDSIYNGADDHAAGATAVLELA